MAACTYIWWPSFLWVTITQPWTRILDQKDKKYLTSYDETRHIKTGEYNDLLVSTCRRFLSLILENYPHNVSYINNRRFTELIKILQKYGVEWK